MICAMMIGFASAMARGQCNPEELAKLIASDAAAIDEFGFFVALSGDTAVIGAFLDDHAGWTDAGSAYVFVRSGGVWTQQAKLTASDPAHNDNFGASVAVSGDTAVVGSYTDDHPPGNDQGSVYVFVRSGAVWNQQAKLTASDTATDDLFGWSVAISGDTIVVGAYGDDTAAESATGSAYVFVKPGGGWTNMTETVKLTASDAMENDEFGYSVAVSGDTAVVGANLDDITGGPGDPFTGHGSAYVFVRSGGVWTQQAKLTASDAAGFDNFGGSVAVSSDTVVIGANRADAPGVANSGAAYVYAKPGGGWTNMTQTAKLLASDAAAQDSFGAAVAVSGNTAVVGARSDDHAGGTNAGSAYVFVKPAGGWVNMTQTAKFTAMDAEASDSFGYSVAVSGDRAVIGAPLDDPGGSNAGSAYVFDLNGEQPSITDPDSQTICEGASASFTVTATGTPPLSYQWRHDGVNLADEPNHISGAQSAMVVLVNTTVADEGDYDCVVSSDGGACSVTSNAATLKIEVCRTCPADIDPAKGNGEVDIDDLFAVIAAWGPCAEPCPPYCQADIDNDCDVDIDDLFAVIASWGPCP